MIFNLPLEQLYALISHYFLVMARISALLHVAPVFSEKAISARLRAALALTSRCCWAGWFLTRI